MEGDRQTQGNYPAEFPGIDSAGVSLYLFCGTVISGCGVFVTATATADPGAID
jgi:hypothetical protein